MILQADVSIDLTRVRANAQHLAATVKTPIHATVKADAYGLGCREVVKTIDDLVAGYCLFGLPEITAANLRELTAKPILTMGPPDSLDPQDYLALHVRPAVSSVVEAASLRRAGPVLCLDTGMQRFTCDVAQFAAVLLAGDCREVFTHAVRPEQVTQFLAELGDRRLIRHAIGSSLLHLESAWLDLVRPGIALYRSAVTVSTPLIEVHESRPPVGYGGFNVARHGIILCGYSLGALRPGPCQINGVRRRVIEVGMQSAYVEIGPEDRVGDPVILLGEGVSENDIAQVWKTSPHSVLVHLTRCGPRRYVGGEKM